MFSIYSGKCGWVSTDQHANVWGLWQLHIEGSMLYAGGRVGTFVYFKEHKYVSACMCLRVSYGTCTICVCNLLHTPRNDRRSPCNNFLRYAVNALCGKHFVMISLTFCVPGTCSSLMLRLGPRRHSLNHDILCWMCFVYLLSTLTCAAARFLALSESVSGYGYM